MALILAALFEAFISLPGVAPIVNGFVRGVLQQLPMEFLAERQKPIPIGLEGSVG